MKHDCGNLLVMLLNASFAIITAKSVKAGRVSARYERTPMESFKA
jgi:hypothetical protein